MRRLVEHYGNDWPTFTIFPEQRIQKMWWHGSFLQFEGLFCRYNSWGFEWQIHIWIGWLDEMAVDLEDQILKLNVKFYTQSIYLNINFFMTLKCWPLFGVLNIPPCPKLSDHTDLWDQSFAICAIQSLLPCDQNCHLILKTTDFHLDSHLEILAKNFSRDQSHCGWHNVLCNPGHEVVMYIIWQQKS